jgi:two-component system, NarL family, response regulator DevR
MTILVFLLDDHEIVRRGLADLLEVEDDITVVGQAATAAQALAWMLALRPHVAVLDVRLPDSDGVSVGRELRSSMTPPPACLLLTSHSDDEALLSAIMAGACGYLIKQIRGVDLVGAIRTVARGGSLLDPTATAAMRQRMRRGRVPDDPRYAMLSAQQRRILDHIADGRTNHQIGAHMHLTEKTVKDNVSTLLHKLGVTPRTEAAVFATERRRPDR